MDKSHTLNLGKHTVDGRNPAPPKGWLKPYYETNAYELVQDFFHPSYLGLILKTLKVWVLWRVILLIPAHSGWWLSHPSEKYESIGMAIPKIWKNRKCSKPPTSIKHHETTRFTTWSHRSGGTSLKRTLIRPSWPKLPSKTPAVVPVV